VTAGPISNEEKRGLSKRGKVIVVVAILATVTALGTFEAHNIALENSLSPGSVILSPSEVAPLMPNANSWNIPYLPSGSNVASVDYTNSSPLPALGGNVTSPNIVLIIIKNSTSKSASFGYLYLRSHIQEVIGNSIDQGSLYNVTVAGYRGEYFGFYNLSANAGAIVTAVYNYIVLVIVYNLHLTTLTQVFSMQINKIYTTLEFDHNHYIL
jgi:hypothetical protein